MVPLRIKMFVENNRVSISLSVKRVKMETPEDDVAVSIRLVLFCEVWSKTAKDRANWGTLTVGRNMQLKDAVKRKRREEERM